MIEITNSPWETHRNPFLYSQHCHCTIWSNHWLIILFIQYEVQLREKLIFIETLPQSSSLLLTISVLEIKNCLYSLNSLFKSSINCLTMSYDQEDSCEYQAIQNSSILFLFSYSHLSYIHTFSNISFNRKHNIRSITIFNCISNSDFTIWLLNSQYLSIYNTFF